MERSELSVKLKKLLDQSKRLTFKSLPLNPSGYVMYLPPEWYAWVQRVENIISNHFNGNAAPNALVRHGFDKSGVIVGNGQENFDRAISFFKEALSGKQ